MMTTPPQDFDPRFDPAFQRGFSGEQRDPRDAQRPGASAQGASSYAANDYGAPQYSQPPRPTPVATRTVSPGQPAVGPSAQSPATAPRDDFAPQEYPGGVFDDFSTNPHADPNANPDAAADAARPRRANPFLIALAAISVLLVVGGAWGVQAARDPFLRSNAAANTDYVGLQILAIFAPVAIVLGIATAVGILFVYAVRWRG
jgi:hypothetical protein